jgi:hypothetical protein
MAFSTLRIADFTQRFDNISGKKQDSIYLPRDGLPRDAGDMKIIDNLRGQRTKNLNPWLAYSG